LPFTWRNIVTAFALLAVVMLIQIFMTDLPFQPQPAQPVVLQVALLEPAAIFGPSTAVTPPATMQMQLTVDGELLLSRSLATDDWRTPEPTPVFAEQMIVPGEHHVELRFVDEASRLQLVLYDETAVLEPGQILRLDFRPSEAAGCLRDCP